MAHGVDDWVQAGGGLGHEGWDLRQEGRDGALAADASQENDKGVGRPDASPQGHVGHGHLGNPHLGGLGVLGRVGAQGVDVHFLGLGEKFESSIKKL